MYSVKPDVMRMVGDPPKDPWMAGEKPGVPVSYRELEPGMMPPPGWGIAWEEAWAAGRVVIMPIPFNIIGGLIWKSWRWLKWPRFIRKCWEHQMEDRARLALENQRLREEVKFLQMRVGGLEYQVAPYPMGGD